MPPVVIPDCVQVVASGTVLGRPWTSVFHIDASGLAEPLIEAAATGIAAVFDGYYDSLVPARSQEWVENSIRVVDIRDAAGPSYEFNVPAEGTGSGEPLPPNMAIVTSWRTLKRGPRYRGRTYGCGFTEDQMEDGRLDSVALAAEQVAAQGLLDALEAEGSSLVIASRKYLTFEPVTGLIVNDVFDGQVRRRFPQ